MTAENYQIISTTLGLPIKIIKNVEYLLESGATIPFIARYRKEQIDSIDEVKLLAIQSMLDEHRELEKRKAYILQTIEEQGKLTDELRLKITQCYVSSVLEDIYLPYKPKRNTRAEVARKKGLQPLADYILQQSDVMMDAAAETFLTDEVPTTKDALQGAKDIVAEFVNEHETVRKEIRFLFDKQAKISSTVAKKKEEEAQKYLDYHQFSETLNKIPSHRLLAVLRGEREELLKVSVTVPEEAAIEKIERAVLKKYVTNQATNLYKEAIADAYDRLLQPSIETEFIHKAKEKADKEAIEVFALNLKQLLLASPLGQKRILAIDPGFRTGCKIVCLDEQGNLLHNTTIYPHPPQREIIDARKKVAQLVEMYKIDAIAVGNGTAGRETEEMIKNISFNKTVNVFAVNEDGASIYSASPVAREEFPEYDVTVRGAVSIGRRLADPLSELVKIEPKSLGVGQYQHDVNPKMLNDTLTATVLSCVNSVGVNVNIASEYLLTYISGLGKTLAKNIVNYRKENGFFKSREEFKNVPRMGSKAFEQCAGFLRIENGDVMLDNTAVHPESYAVVEKMAKDIGVSVEELINNKEKRSNIVLHRYITEKVGLPTLQDIMSELEKPGRDPRGTIKAFEFSDIKTIEDLIPGIIIPGIIVNITNFGAFVDIGIKESGLVHISELSDTFTDNPHKVVKLNQHVMAKVLAVDIPRKRISLSLKNVKG